MNDKTKNDTRQDNLNSDSKPQTLVEKSVDIMEDKFTNSFQYKSKKCLLNRYKLILAVLFFCGFNLKVFKFFNKYRILSFIYCLSLTIIITLSTHYCNGNTDNLQIWSLVEYVSSVAVLIIYNSKLSSFSIKLSEIDTYLRVSINYYYKSKTSTFISLIILWIIRIAYTTIHCLYYSCFTHTSLYIISLFSYFALDMYRVLRFSILDIVRYRLKLLHKRLEEHPGYNGYLYINKNKTIKENKVKFCTKLYKSIADLMDLINPELHASMFVSVFCSIPKLIINIYHILLVLEGREPMGSLGFLIMHTSQVCFLLFSPSIIVELLLVEVERIRLYLIHCLIEETDPRVKEDIQEFLQYTEIRNFQCKIWRVIPLNVALPLEVTNICTSSVIVAINFTHLYG